MAVNQNLCSGIAGSETVQAGGDVQVQGISGLTKTGISNLEILQPG
jgi:hypothetical protein